MRLGTRSSNDFIQILNKKDEEIQQAFLTKMTDLSKMVDANVMMGDSTVTIQKTFDPAQVNNFYQQFKSLKDWTFQDVSISNNEDIRRIFTKFEIMEGNYLISVHLSLQFHVLLYYKPDQRVIDSQKELSDIIDLMKNKEQELSDDSDLFVLNKLKEMGYKDLDHQKLFEIFYENNEVREKIYKDIENNFDVDFKKLEEKKMKLFNELDSLLIETYQTTPIMIDDTRLVTGEEGFLCTIDIEFIKNKSKEGLFDPKKMSKSTKENIMKRLEELYQVMN